ncbi:hypothetical protein GG344DRAFT_75712 [Lentinula edodes]|nr:hypothetical protein GG344DRAFT_75712 [Lentinula edodes]
MRFIGVYLFLALVSVGFAVPLSAEKEADRSLEARSNSGPSKPSRGNFYDDFDDEHKDITMEEALRRQQAKEEAELQKSAKTTSLSWPSWMKKSGGKNGGKAT